MGNQTSQLGLQGHGTVLVARDNTLPPYSAFERKAIAPLIDLQQALQRFKAAENTLKDRRLELSLLLKSVGGSVNWENGKGKGIGLYIDWLVQRTTSVCRALKKSTPQNLSVELSETLVRMLSDLETVLVAFNSGCQDLRKLAKGSTLGEDVSTERRHIEKIIETQAYGMRCLWNRMEVFCIDVERSKKNKRRTVDTPKPLKG